MNKIGIIKEKAIFLNRLSNNEHELFEFLNSNKENLQEVLQKYEPINEFRPVNTLRFLIANELIKGNFIDKSKVEELKKAIEDRDISAYYNLNAKVKDSLNEYKDSKSGMFPNWSHTFKILFPFIHSISENEEVKMILHQLADEVIEKNKLENVSKHIVSFQGSQNYGADRIWVAIIPNSAPSVQYAYQIFFAIDCNGFAGGIHKGHNLVKQEYENKDVGFDVFEDYVEKITLEKDNWKNLNSKVDFIFINDEKEFVKNLKKINTSHLNNYFKILDRLKLDLDIQDEEKLVFSLAKNRLSFQVGKRYCLNINKTGFDFISNKDIENDNEEREVFEGTGSTFLYQERALKQVLSNYENIKVAVETEIERDNHAKAKYYDNSAFRKAVFDENYRNKVMNIKYWALGFGSDYKRLESFKSENFWSALDYGDNDTSSAAKVARKYFNQIKAGDKAIIKGYGGSHDLSIHYKGIVVKKDTVKKILYFEKINDDLYRGKAPKGKGGGNWQNTIIEVKRQKDINLLFYGIKEQNIKDITSKFQSNYEPSLNQIFYGPPGTGKTYHTVLEAAKIITQDEDISYEEAKNEFQLNLGENIEFITFHQNYSYEDFIQGLRPDTDISGELSFYKSDGVFKRLADKALKNLKDAENPETAKKDFKQVFSDIIKPLNEGDLEELEIKMKKTSFYITEIGEKSIEFRKNQGESKHTLSINTLNKMYDKGVNDLILGGLQPYYNPILDLLLENGKSSVEVVEKQNYVIIIDEINRANISRVFGELITLIEKDKRSHGDLPLTTTLPSGEKFIVPSNLYIIGTMNTADKSIALLDIALRRRFEFVPMYPDSSSTETKIVNDAVILDNINKEIINRKGHDFTIGHSYFMGENYDLKNTIDNKVIPLLLEYFMNDFDEVKKILKSANINVDGWPMKYISND